mmetsp:Transcript_63465/g.169772  ORF Transcript_63465/g.169772 Transcript_63465/m.169772 type:complete len:119 (-) Transcript_63465:566-922(-)
MGRTLDFRAASFTRTASRDEKGRVQPRMQFLENPCSSNDFQRLSQSHVPSSTHTPHKKISGCPSSGSEGRRRLEHRSSLVWDSELEHCLDDHESQRNRSLESLHLLVSIRVSYPPKAA